MFTVKTTAGEIVGKRKKGIGSFKGIPFAEPPIGELRFAPPADKVAWEHPLDCTSFRSASLQCFSKLEKNAPKDIVPGSSEDCLYLNVWTPAQVIQSGGDQSPDSTQKLPVYVFFHGGAFATGSGSEPLYGGQTFAEQGIVYVSVNYRLNVLGFLPMRTLMKEYGSSGNLGLMDQVKALQWVRDNITAFGGDPDCVTIGGESAGAYSVSALMFIKEAKGLFHRAIMESGALLSMTALSTVARCNLERSYAMGKVFLDRLGIEDSLEGLEKLRQIDAKELTWKSVFFDNGRRAIKEYSFWPVFDGGLLPLDPFTAMQEGDFFQVDVLLGYNTDEGSWFVPLHFSQEDYENYIRELFLHRADEVLKRFPAYGDSSPGAMGRFVLCLAGFRLGMKMLADRLSEMGKDVYAYHYNYPAPAEADTDLGVRHALELFFVFNKYLRAVGADNEEGQKVADVMHIAWSNFIKTGDPNKGKPLPQDIVWQKYKKGQGKTLRIEPICEMEEQQHFEELEFLEKILFSGSSYYND